MNLPFELKWGLIIGLANLGWLYLSYYLGMHTSGLLMVQIMSLVALVITVVGYVWAMRSFVQKLPETTFLEAIRSAALIVGLVAVIAVIAQWGYHKVVHPGFTDFMVSETTKHFETEGLSGQELKVREEMARGAFGMGTYMFQSALFAFLTGLITSSITLGFLLRKRRA